MIGYQADASAHRRAESCETSRCSSVELHTKRLRDLQYGGEARADDPTAARLVVARVLEAVAQLADQSGLGRPGRVPSARELAVARTRCILPYRVERDAVEILRVFHPSRHLPKRRQPGGRSRENWRPRGQDGNGTRASSQRRECLDGSAAPKCRPILTRSNFAVRAP